MLGFFMPRDGRYLGFVWNKNQGMFRMNGQDYCSGQTLSTYIHVSNSAVPWMARSVYVQGGAVSWFCLEQKPRYVQDERYSAVAGMPWSVYVQDERYSAVPWMHGAYMFRMNGQDYCSGQILSTYIHVSNSAVPWTVLCSCKIQAFM